MITIEIFDEPLTVNIPTNKDVGHVMAWAKGGMTDTRNCYMLCKTRNRAKGNG